MRDKQGKKNFTAISEKIDPSEKKILKMVLVASAPEPTIYYKETASHVRESRFCLKQVQMVQPRTEKRPEAINVQVSSIETSFLFVYLNRLSLTYFDLKNIYLVNDCFLQQLNIFTILVHFILA
jgi:hypothetical protein